MKISEELYSEKNPYTISLFHIKTDKSLEELFEIIKNFKGEISSDEIPEIQRKDLISPELISDNKIKKKISAFELKDKIIFGVGEVEKIKSFYFRGNSYFYPLTISTKFSIMKLNPVFYAVLNKRSEGVSLMGAIASRLRDFRIIISRCHITKENFINIIERLEANLNHIGLKLFPPYDRLTLRMIHGESLLDQPLNPYTQLMDNGDWDTLKLEIDNDALHESPFLLHITADGEITIKANVDYSAVNFLLNSILPFVSWTTQTFLDDFIGPPDEN